MIEFTRGDMFEVPADARVNTVNCVGVMGAGVALNFKNRYPEMFREYKAACKDGRVRPGALHVWKNLTGEWVINFPTKRDWREPSRYEDIQSGLEALRDYLTDQGPITLTLPALGCGHGGLDWSKVASMIEAQLSDVDARIFVFEPADSLALGRSTRETLTASDSESLRELGFEIVENTPVLKEANISGPVLTKGDTALLRSKWIALLPSKEPSEREKAALKEVALQLSLMPEPQTVALVYSNRSSENIAQVFRSFGVRTVLILPFGPLTKKSLSRLSDSPDEGPSMVLVSVTSPSDAWSRQALARSMSLLRSAATSALLSDPSPAWFDMKAAKSWSDRTMLYFRSSNQPETARRALESAGARAVTLKERTGEPDIAPLVQGNLPKAHPPSVESENKASRPGLDAFLSPQSLRDIADEMERHPSSIKALRVVIPATPETRAFHSVIQRILRHRNQDTGQDQIRSSMWVSLTETEQP